MKLFIPKSSSSWCLNAMEYLNQFELDAVLRSGPDIDDFVEGLVESAGGVENLDQVEWVLNRQGEAGNLEAWLLEECLCSLEDIEWENKS